MALNLSRRSWAVWAGRRFSPGRRGLGIALESRDVMHSAIQMQGLAGVLRTYRQPTVGDEPPGLLRVADLREPAARLYQDPGQRVNDIGVSCHE
jgi:hypothetical protein